MYTLKHTLKYTLKHTFKYTLKHTLNTAGVPYDLAEATFLNTL